jgi:HSP20 family molecular chaperone IbpA
MFFFKYRPVTKSYADLQAEALTRVNDYLNYVTTHFQAEDDDSMEQSSTHIKYTIDLPGIAPERVGVKLSADRKNVNLIIDGVINRIFTPPVVNTLKPEDLSVQMEHGRLTIRIDRKDKEKTATEDEVSIPINGKQFLQE